VKGYGLCHIILLTIVLHVHGPMLRRFNDLRRLVPETLGDLLVPLLHLLVRHVELGFSRLVRRNLRRRGACHPLRPGSPRSAGDGLGASRYSRV
jgi:hypothetical protein